MYAFNNYVQSLQLCSKFQIWIYTFHVFEILGTSSLIYQSVTEPSTSCKMVKWPTNKALINQYLTIPKIESIESCSEKAKGKDFHYLGKG